MSSGEVTSLLYKSSRAIAIGWLVQLVLLAAVWTAVMSSFKPSPDAASHGTSKVSDGSHRRHLRLPDATRANETIASGHQYAISSERRLGAHQLNPTNQDASKATFDQSHRGTLFSDIQLEHTVYKLPYYLEQNLADWEDFPVSEHQSLQELPVFWHVLKSGGTTMKSMYAQCYRLVEACETGASIEKEQQQRLQLTGGQALPVQQGSGNHPSPFEWVQQQQQEQARLQYVPPGGGRARRLQQESSQQLRVITSDDGRKYVNVDVTTPQGILSASQLGFASSNLADIMFTPLLHESAQSLLNKDTRRGRLFAIFRHPVERVTSLFYYLQGATWEPTHNPEYVSWTIDDYARSQYCESNWMVRALANKMTGTLTPDDVGVAQEVLRRKCLVGLMERMGESMVHFQAYFGFKNSNTYFSNAIKCANDRYAPKGSLGSNSHAHPVPERGSETWEILEKKNGLDMRLFEYAEKLFEEQGNRLKKEIDIVMTEVKKKTVII